MGSKEEQTAPLIVYGYSGKIRPNQDKAGPCSACKEIVYIDPRPSEIVSAPFIKYFHFACSAP